jgi:hypothetical protein
LDPENLEKLQKIGEMGDRRGEMLPKSKRRGFGSLQGVVYSLILQNVMLPCKISKQKLAGNAAKYQ